jgi:cytosine/adenosine deaminase-related metal-dependent hydrolase
MVLLIKPSLLCTPETILRNTGIYIDTETGTIVELSENLTLPHDFEINFDHDVVAFPALINAHDHMVGSYYPKVGKGPYNTWKEWDDAWKASEIFAERANIDNFRLYMLGVYKNLLSGVTTVMDHVPHKVNEEILPKLPLRTIQHYGLAHEVSSYDLKWGDGVKIEHSRAVQNNWPFITHIEEGFDEESQKGIDYLIEENALDEHTVMIHGIALSHADILQIGRHNAHLIWCPESNKFMFSTVAKIQEWLEAGINVSLGTDSTITGAKNILDEMATAREVYAATYGRTLDEMSLLKMVTTNPAKALRLDHKLGKLQKGYLADIVITKLLDRSDPITSLTHASMNDIDLVIKEARPLYGYSDYELFFKKFQTDNYTRETINGSERLVYGNLGRLMREIWTLIGFKKELPFIPIS